MNTSNIENNIDDQLTTKDKVRDFLDKGFSLDRLERLLSSEYREELIDQLIESYNKTYLDIIRLKNNEEVTEKQRDNIIDLFRLISLYKELLNKIGKKESREKELEDRITDLKELNKKLKEELNIKGEDLEDINFIKGEYEKNIKKLLIGVENGDKNSKIYEEVIGILRQEILKLKAENKKIGLEEFLGSKMGQELLDKNVANRTKQLEKENAKLQLELEQSINKNEKLKQENSRLQISLNQIKQTFLDFKIKVKRKIDGLPTKDEVLKLKEKIKKLIIEKTDYVKQFGNPMQEKVQEVENRVQDLENQLDKLTKELEAKKEEVKQLKVANNTVDPHIQRKAKKAYEG